MYGNALAFELFQLGKYFCDEKINTDPIGVGLDCMLDTLCETVYNCIAAIESIVKIELPGQFTIKNYVSQTRAFRTTCKR